MDKREKNIADNMQALLLYGSVLLLCLQLFGERSSIMHAAVRMGYYWITAGLIMLVGYLACQWHAAGMLKSAGFRLALSFFGIYVVSGVCRFWFIDDRERVRSLFQIVLMRKIPKYSEIYFTIAVLAVFSLWIAPLVGKLVQKRALALCLGVFPIAVTFIPEGLFGYPISGALFGTDTYRSISILAYIGYYFLGFAIAERSRQQKKLSVLSVLAGLMLTGIIVLWKREAMGMAMVFPLSYWEIPVAFGLVLLLVFLCQNLPSSEKLNVLNEKSFSKTALMLLLLYFLKSSDYIGDLRIIWRPILVAAAWVLSTVIIRIGRRVIPWLGKCITETSKVRSWQYICVYSIGFVILSVIVFLPFIENGITFLWQRDAISQYFPKAVYFSQYIRDALQNLFSGVFSLKMYDFSLGLGDRVLLSFDPIYWIYALFTPENMEMGYQIVTLIRFYMIGLSASAMLFYFKKGTKITLICSYIYMFSGYALYAVIRHPQFAVPMTLLPLLIIAVEQILREKKWHLGCVLIAVSLLSNYYFLFMNTIALIVYFLVRFFCMEKEKKTLRNFMNYLGIFAGAYILGVGMGCLTIFTSIFAYAGSARAGTGALAMDSPLYYGSSWLTDVYMFFLTTGKNTGYWLKMGFVPLAYLAVVMLFMRRERKELKILLVICGFCAICPAAGYIFGGMGNVNNRWSYMLALVVMVIIAEILPMIRGLSRREIKILSIAVVPYALIALGYSAYSNEYTLKALALLLITLLLIIFSTEIVGILKKGQAYAVLAIVVLCSLFVNSDTFYGIYGSSEIDEYIAAGEAMESASGNWTRACTEIEDDSFYRVTEKTPGALQLCASMILDENSISYYNSTMNSKILEYSMAMGNIMSSLVEHQNFNNRTFMNALACVKYYGSIKIRSASELMPFGYEYLKDVTIDGTDYIIYENQYSLPLGYTYSHVVGSTDFDVYSVVEKQEIMMTHAVVEDFQASESQYENVQPVISGKEIPISSVECTDAEWEDNIITGEKDSEVTFYFDGLENAETYLVIKGYSETGIEGQEQIGFWAESQCGHYLSLIHI